MNAKRSVGRCCLLCVTLCTSACSQPTLPATPPAAPATQAARPEAPPPPPDFTVVGDSTLDAQGVTLWMISSPYQAGVNGVKVLCPEAATKDATARFPVIYLLQVGPDFGAWGDPIIEAKRLDLHNKYGVILVLPAFKAVKREQLAGHGGGPWYADHPTDADIRHASHIVKALVPFIESRYPALAEPRGRLLLGFSMSGCGAFNLMLRNPDVFGRAAAWDAPAAWQWWTPPPGQPKAPYVYGPQLIAQNAQWLKSGPSRLLVLGYDLYRADGESVHQQLQKLGIPHEYDNDVRHKHGWNSGWLASAVARLVG